ncbi:MAG: M3 family metallopeptidase [Bacteroidota bacterium]|nr:M3 family metallopeptidase [Bacteroidota bacterium]
MKKLFLTLISLIMLTSSVLKGETNPFFTPYKTAFGVPPFDKIKTEHYLPAFIEGIKQHQKEIDVIANNPAPATFANTMAAMEYSGKLLTKVSMVFFNLEESMHNAEMQAIAEKVTPMLTEHSDNILLNEKLFKRVETLYKNRSQIRLTAEQRRVIEEQYKKFIHNGAALNDQQKKELREINKNLAMLQLKFGNNLLAETNSFKMVLDKEEDLAGLPESVKAAAAEDAKAANMPGKWIFTAQKTSWIPFLTYSTRRDLREKLYKGYWMRGDYGNATDNKQVILDIMKNRIALANLLGFKTSADYILDNTMAKTPARVDALLQSIWTPAVAKAKDEVKEMQSIIDSENGGFKLAMWDWWYYAEKVRKAKYDLNEDELKPYFKLENVRKGVFEVAHRLYGINFEKLKNVPVYHPDVEAFKVSDADGKLIGILYTDYFPRASKTVGAWMNNIRDQYIEKGIMVRPVIVNVGNLAKPTATSPSLLSMDDVGTLFHEFGHALHGLLSQCTYPSVSGTSVPRDFVECPSQFMENFAFQPEVMKMYAFHYKTGELMPESLMKKIQNSTYFNQGFEMTELVAASILDMKWHELTSVDGIDVDKFEKEQMDKIGLIPEILPRYRSTYFKHIFNDGYSAGYYSYQWASVFEKDAFELFKEKGIFDPATATSFRKNILERGNSDDPMKFYVKFRGHEPTSDALLKSKGLK